MESKFHYQFMVQFSKKNNEWSRHVRCRTYSSEHDMYLYSLVGSVISFFQVESLAVIQGHISNVQNGKLNHKAGYLVSDEGTAALLFQGEKTQILDLVHTENGIIDGIQGPVNYNLSTPVEYQFLDTSFVLALLSEWCVFLVEQANMVFVPKSMCKVDHE